MIKGHFVTLVSVLLQLWILARETVAYYLALHEVVQRIPSVDKVVILGDFNARVGRDFETWTVMGRHGVGKCNSNGLLLLQFCSEMGFQIGSIMFRQKDKFKNSRMNPGLKQWHIMSW